MEVEVEEELELEVELELELEVVRVHGLHIESNGYTIRY
jgi:hypothetical protein